MHWIYKPRTFIMMAFIIVSGAFGYATMAQAAPLAQAAITIFNVNIDSSGSEHAYVSPGATVSVTLDYAIENGECPDCAVQVQIGLLDDGPATCAYDGVPPGGAADGSATITLVAPVEPGVYALAYDQADAPSCDDALALGWANGVPADSQIIGTITVGDYLGVTINNVGVNYGSDTVIVNAGESFWLALDYHIFDGVCTTCLDQIIFGFSDGAPAACQEVGTPGVDGQRDFFSFPLTAPTQPGDYTIGYDRSQSLNCTDALNHGWWTTPPSGARILAHITVPATPVAYDYGDAPEPGYFTLISNGGARHALTNGLNLGATVDSEADGQPSADASSDGADEDGVTFPATLTVCAQNEITVNASADGVLNAWIDYAGNGDFADYDDQAIAALPISAGSHQVTLDVPCAPVTLGQPVPARFRLSSEANLAAQGDAPDGEVEDYTVQLVRGGPSLLNDYAETTEDAAVLIDVLANDNDQVSGGVTLTAVGAPAYGTAVIENGQIRYTPQPGQYGVDSFTYTAANEVNKTNTAQVFVSVQPTNDPPSGVTLSKQTITVQPGNGNGGPLVIAPGTLVGTVGAQDSDTGDSFTFLLGGEDADAFALIDNQLTIAGFVELPYDPFTPTTNPVLRTWQITITARDERGQSVSQPFAITAVLPATDPPTLLLPKGQTLPEINVRENGPANQVVAELTVFHGQHQPAAAYDVAAPYALALVDGEGADDNSRFQLNGAQLIASQPLDYEAKPIYSVRVQVTDNQGQKLEQILLLLVEDEAEVLAAAPPEECRNAPIDYLTSPNATVKLTNVEVSNVGEGGCEMKAKMSITVRGVTRDVTVEGKATKGGLDLGSKTFFEFPVAGLTLKVRRVKTESNLGRNSVQLEGASLCAPQGWGGFCSLLVNQASVNYNGLQLGGRIPLPEFKVGKVGKKGLNLTNVEGELKPVAGGYEITAGATFGIAKLTPTKLKGRGCEIEASLTIYSGAGGQAVMEINAAAAQAPDAVELRQVSVGYSCDRGIPIDSTGLQLTGIKGTVTLREEEKSVQLELTFNSMAKAGPLDLVEMKTAGKLIWDPEWGADIGGVAKLLNTFEIGRADAQIREGRFSFTGYMVGNFTKSQMKLNAWTLNGSFYLTGSGKVSFVVRRGLIFDALDRVCNALKAPCNQVQASSIQSPDGPGNPPKKKCYGKNKKGERVQISCPPGPPTLAGVLTAGAKAVAKAANAVACFITKTVCNVVGIAIPPFDIPLGSVNGDFGRFTNDNWGVKAYFNVGEVLGGVGEAVVTKFGIPRNLGAYFDHKGKVSFGDVTKYQLVRPPVFRAALARFQALQAAQASSAEMSIDGVNGITMRSENEVVIRTPLALNPQLGEISAAIVISQVRVTAPATVTFILSSDLTPTMSLIAPNGLVITPDNFNLPEVTNRYKVTYERFTTYERLQPVDYPAYGETRARLIVVGQAPAFTAVDVWVDGQKVWSNVASITPQTLNDYTAANYRKVEAGHHTITVTPAGQTTPLLSQVVPMEPGVGYSLVVIGNANPVLNVVTDEGATPPNFEKRYLRFYHASDPNRRITVLVDGNPLFTGLSYQELSQYKTVPDEPFELSIIDADSQAEVAPARFIDPLPGEVSTQFLYELSDGAYSVGQIGAVDDIWTPYISTVYNVGGAEMGDWKVDLVGDLTDPRLTLAAIAYPTPAQLLKAYLKDGANLSAVHVRWQMLSAYKPTKLRYFANPGPLSQSVTYTDTNGIARTEVISMFTGIETVDYDITDDAYLNGQESGFVTNFSDLESGTYHLWVQVDDGKNAPQQMYVIDPATNQPATLVVNNPIVLAAASWTPQITTTLDTPAQELIVQWSAYSHPDIDSYTLYLGTAPSLYTISTTGYSLVYPLDSQGNPTGAPVGSGGFGNIEPGVTYYLLVEAVDEETGRAVRSPEVTVSASPGSYALNTSSSTYTVNPGGTLDIPVGLQVSQPLYYPEVALDLNAVDNPPGLVTRFARDYTGDTTLRDSNGTVALTVQGAAAQVVTHRDGEVQAAAPDTASASLLVNISKYLAPGTYPVTVSGVNGQNQPVTTTVMVVVTTNPLLTVSNAGTGSGTVTSNPAGIDCGTLCSAAFAPNTVVTLTATPTTGSLFGGWSGACAGSGNTCQVTMDAAKGVTATFMAAQSNNGGRLYLPLIRK